MTAEPVSPARAAAHARALVEGGALRAARRLRDSETRLALLRRAAPEKLLLLEGLGRERAHLRRGVRADED